MCLCMRFGTIVLLVGFGIVIGLLPGIIFRYSYLGLLATKAAEHKCTQSFPYTDKSLDCAELDSSIETMKSLDKSLTDFVTQAIADKKASQISVWVRDLQTKQWAAVNEF